MPPKKKKPGNRSRSSSRSSISSISSSKSNKIPKKKKSGNRSRSSSRSSISSSKSNKTPKNKLYSSEEEFDTDDGNFDLTSSSDDGRPNPDDDERKSGGDDYDEGSSDSDEQSSSDEGSISEYQKKKEFYEAMGQKVNALELKEHRLGQTPSNLYGLYNFSHQLGRISQPYAYNNPHAKEDAPIPPSLAIALANPKLIPEQRQKLEKKAALYKKYNPKNYRTSEAMVEYLESPYQGSYHRNFEPSGIRYTGQPGIYDRFHGKPPPLSLSPAYQTLKHSKSTRKRTKPEPKPSIFFPNARVGGKRTRRRRGRGGKRTRGKSRKKRRKSRRKKRRRKKRTKRKRKR